MVEHPAKGKSSGDPLFHEGKPRAFTIEDPSLAPTVRLMYRDDDGKDWDVEAMREAIIAIHANTGPKAVSLSPKNRIRAIYQICDQVVPK